MKYEPVFGDQSLFDGAPEDAEMAASVCQSPRWYAMLNGIVLFCDSKKESWQSAAFNHPGSKLLAMRRIIADPKRWTVEDQKAGRLPEVDCVVRATGMNEDARIAAINNDSVCVVFKDGTFVTLHVSGIAPIEAPEERAKREEDEFVDSESFFIDVCTMSGPMKAAYKQGARAAYRKLKGGE